MFPAVRHRKQTGVGLTPVCLAQPGSLIDNVSICPTRQQELDNLLHEKRYLRALGLAISLDRPHTVLTVIQGQYLPQGQAGFGGGSRDRETLSLS